jgi:3-O-methylgallate 3,4-dioxygenase
MASLAAAFASSHSVMLSATLEDWLTRFRESDPRMPYYNRDGAPCSYADVLARASPRAQELIAPPVLTAAFHRVQEAMAALREKIAAARLDVLLVVGDDQHELFKDALMPALAVYFGTEIQNGMRPPVPPEDWYRQAQVRRLEDDAARRYPCDRDLALHLIEGLTRQEFDVAAVAGLAPGQYEGHAFSFVHRWYLHEAPVPLVPIFLNTYYPPNPPTPQRCLRLGAALRELIAEYPRNVRVGVMASGGLSHFVVEEDLDRAILAALQRKDFDFLGALDPQRLKAGSSEIRNWLVAARAAVDLELDWVSYTPAYRTPALTGTGLGFASWI